MIDRQLHSKIKKLRHNTLEELERDIEQAWDSLSVETLHRSWSLLWVNMREILVHGGDNDFKFPHSNLRKAHEAEWAKPSPKAVRVRLSKSKHKKAEDLLNGYMAAHYGGSNSDSGNESDSESDCESDSKSTRDNLRSRASR